VNPSTTTPPLLEGRDTVELASVRLPTDVHPIIAGFHPDPTICRAGDDYYIAHSSFEYMPGIPIWHSTDLTSWTLIGNALTRDDQFSAGSAHPSKGVFAPTLRYRNGQFWLITTNVTGHPGQLVLSADDPAGPWSAGTHLHGLHGIDPDLAWDADGTCYVTYCSTEEGRTGIAQAKVDLASGTVLTEPHIIWQGTGMAFPEAPHLYYRQGWWYLVIAEGGTERGHSVSVARSARPEGPFTSYGANPILTHRSTTLPVQNTGHADLVENTDGTWAAVYLGVRPRGVTPMFHVNGRETFLTGIDWKDGWPMVNATRYTQPVPDRSFSDSFPGPGLHPRWISPGAAVSDQVLETGEAGLLLQPASSVSGSVSAVMTRAVSQCWAFEIDIDPGAGEAGLLVRLDDDHWIEARVTAGTATGIVHIGPFEGTTHPSITVSASLITVRASSLPSRTSGPDDLCLSLISDRRETVLARIDGRYLSTEVAGGFTGRVIGFRALKGAVRVQRAQYDDHDFQTPEDAL
jgi:xylan 1,4-beta-xylosidase